jgi:hypothetical protein
VAWAAWISNSPEPCDSTLKSPGFPGLFVYLKVRRLLIAVDFLIVAAGRLVKTICEARVPVCGFTARDRAALH